MYCVGRRIVDDFIESERLPQQLKAELERLDQHEEDFPVEAFNALKEMSLRALDSYAYQFLTEFEGVTTKVEETMTVEVERPKRYSCKPSDARTSIKVSERVSSTSASSDSLEI